MDYKRKLKLMAAAILALAANLPVSGCAGLSSPLDQAYYTNGAGLPGGYTRTIFSSSNF